MTENLQRYKSQIQKALDSKDFNALFSLFATNSFSFTELLVFYKRNNGSKISSENRLFLKKEFWTSQLPHFHLNRILESDLKVTFIQSYLEKDEYCNHELNSHLLAIAKHEFLKFIKLQQAFNHTAFYDSLRLLSKSDSELARVVKEFDIVIRVQKRISDEERGDENYFLQFSFGEIALAFTLYYYQFKQKDQVAGNKSWQTKIEMTLVHELTNIISLLKGKPNLNFLYKDNDELQKHYQQNEAPHHILGKKGLVVPLEPKFQLLYSLIGRLINRKIQKTQIELYLCEYSDFQSVILNPAMLQTNSNYRAFKINNEKSIPEELYFIRYNNPVRTDITTGIEVLNFYGVPQTIECNNATIELSRALQLLKYFSVYKGPVERMIFPDGSYNIMNKPEKSFIELFGSNESITLFDFDTLYLRISKYFTWTEEETKKVLSFLTLDLTAIPYQGSWIGTPFLQLGNQILWLGSFLKDRRWDNVLLNKLKKYSGQKSIEKGIARNFEDKIEELFKSKSFKTACGLPFKSSNGQSGDFDVLAFKDSHLIVCEAKTGTRSDDFIHAARTEAVRLEGCAAEQLEKAIFNIKDDWTNIKVKLGINKDIELGEVKISPLIVTDIFEGDLQLYKSSIRKTSLLELEVLLKNKKKDLLENYLRIRQHSNSLNPDIKEERDIIPNWDLWDGKKECEVETLLKNIEQNAIWKEIETVWKFEDESYMLEY